MSYLPSLPENQAGVPMMPCLVYFVPLQTSITNFNNNFHQIPRTYSGLQNLNLTQQNQQIQGQCKIVTPFPTYQTKSIIKPKPQVASSLSSLTTTLSLSNYSGAFQLLKKERTINECGQSERSQSYIDSSQFKSEQNIHNCGQVINEENLKKQSQMIINLAMLQQKAAEKEKIQKFLDDVEKLESKEEDSEYVTFDENNTDKDWQQMHQLQEHIKQENQSTTSSNLISQSGSEIIEQEQQQEQFIHSSAQSTGFISIEDQGAMGDLRKMKSEEQVKILEHEFQKDSNWSKDKMKQLSQLLGLKQSQVYKWNWDRKQIREKYIEGRLKSMDLLPNQIFKISKVIKNDQKQEVEVDITNKNGYFKILKSSNLQQI